MSEFCEYSWEILDEIGEHFLEMIRQHPGATTVELGQKLGISLSRVESALAYADAQNLIVGFCDHWFIATTAAEREFAARITQLWDEVASIVRIRQ